MRTFRNRFWLHSLSSIQYFFVHRKNESVLGVIVTDEGLPQGHDSLFRNLTLMKKYLLSFVIFVVHEIKKIYNLVTTFDINKYFTSSQHGT